MRTRPPNPTGPVARGMVFVALVLLMGSLSWVRTFAVYTVAWLDGSHAPHVGLGPDGFQVVLEHDRLHDLATEAGNAVPGHVHRWGARLLILLAHEEGPHADHVVMLGSDGGPFETGRENRMASTPPQSLPDASHESGTVSLPAIARRSQGRFVSDAPPSTTALNVQLRCTRLLI